MNRVKFKIMHEGKRYRPPKDGMVVMNGSGVFFLVRGMGDWDTYVVKLSTVIKNYIVIWE